MNVRFPGAGQRVPAPGTKQTRNHGAERRLLDVLHLAERGLSSIQDYRKVWGLSTDPYESATEKFIAESALLVLIASRTPNVNSNIGRSLEHIGELLAPLVRNPEKAALMVQHPNVALPFGIAHVALDSLAIVDADFSAIVQTALLSGHVTNIERLPYRRLEVAWLSALLDGSPADHRTHWSGSIINGDPHPMYMTTADVYALTHTLFFLTDFGHGDLPSEVDVLSLGECVDSCLAWQLSEENVDTVGELLISALLLRTPLSSVATACWDTVDALWDELGFLPGPGLNPDSFKELSGVDRDAYVFQNTYHTMYVAGILNALAMQLTPFDETAMWERATMTAESMPYLVQLVYESERGMPLRMAEEASITQAGRAGLFDEMAAILAEARQLSAYTLREATNTLKRWETFQQRYG